jgi:hypothetical protein
MVTDLDELTSWLQLDCLVAKSVCPTILILITYARYDCVRRF